MDGPWEYGRLGRGAADEEKGTHKLTLREALSLDQEALLELTPQAYSAIERAKLLFKKACRQDVSCKKGEAVQPRGLWICGPPGTGKSSTIRDVFGDDLYVKPQNKWWDGYDDQKHVLLDDHDTTVLGHYIKIWADAYPF